MIIPIRVWSAVSEPGRSVTYFTTRFHTISSRLRCVVSEMAYDYISRWPHWRRETQPDSDNGREAAPLPHANSRSMHCNDRNIIISLHHEVAKRYSRNTHWNERNSVIPPISGRKLHRIRTEAVKMWSGRSLIASKGTTSPNLRQAKTYSSYLREMGKLLWPQMRTEMSSQRLISLTKCIHLRCPVKIKTPRAIKSSWGWSWTKIHHHAKIARNKWVSEVMNNRSLIDIPPLRPCVDRSSHGISFSPCSGNRQNNQDEGGCPRQ